MGIIIFAVALATVTGIGVYLTERVDRPRRRAERQDAAALARH
jgi:hypothetical protein